MNTKQIDAIRCAQADLIGALQAYQQSDIHVHDWRSHLLTIQELTDAFADFLEPFADVLEPFADVEEDDDNA